MTKEQAILKIRDIQSGNGVNRDIIPVTMRGRCIRSSWDDGLVTLAFEYGYMMCLMETFDISPNDLGYEN